MRRRHGDPAVKKINVTVGEYIEAVAARSLFSPKTLQSYAQALRKITGDIVGETKREKRDAGGLVSLTPEKIEAWRIEFIRGKATDPLKEKSARVSEGSFILRARSLFSAEMVARVRDILELPDSLPFCRRQSRNGTYCRATGALSTSLRCSKSRGGSWPRHRPEEYKILLLGAMAGLKRNEIDVLPWSAFRWNEGLIRIETTEFYRPKSHSSEGDVHVDPELMEVFPRFSTRGAKSDFVIESNSLPPTL